MYKGHALQEGRGCKGAAYYKITRDSLFAEKKIKKAIDFPLTEKNMDLNEFVVFSVTIRLRDYLSIN